MHEILENSRSMELDDSFFEYEFASDEAVEREAVQVDCGVAAVHDELNESAPCTRISTSITSRYSYRANQKHNCTSTSILSVLYLL